MAAHDPKANRRYFFTYQANIDQHTMMMRCSDTVGGPAAQSAFTAIFNALAPQLWLTTPVKLEIAFAGSDVRLPVAGTSFPTSWGAGVPSLRDSVYGIAFPGRGSLGAKSRVYVIPTKLQGDNNYRYNNGESAPIDAVIAYLNSSAPELWWAADGTKAAWYSYATSKQNDHFVGRRRGGT